MNLIDLEPPQNRAGHIVCTCDDNTGLTAEPAAAPALAATALGYGLNILSQTLTIAVLPIAGATLAPRPLFATLPYAATLVGALVASLVAALLNNLFGRRAAFAMGASLGMAGAGLAAWSTFQGQFAGLCLGAFWLGTAQAFGLFYRHSAAIHGRDPKRAVALVLGAGALAAVSAPSLMQLAQVQAGPFAPAMALALAGLVQVAVSALSLLQPGRSLAAPRLPRAPGLDMNFLLATAIGAAAWFGMTLLMAASPGLMKLCGIRAAGVSAAVSWHLLAMYIPAAVAGFALPALRSDWIAGFGLFLLIAAVLIIGLPASLIDFGLVLIVAGCGWSLAMFGSTLTLHAGGEPSAALLAGHDAALFAGAIGGAMSAALII